MTLLVEEETKFKLELRRRDVASEPRSPINVATQSSAEHAGDR